MTIFFEVTIKFVILVILGWRSHYFVNVNFNEKSSDRDNLGDLFKDFSAGMKVRYPENPFITISPFLPWHGSTVTAICIL